MLLCTLITFDLLSTLFVCNSSATSTGIVDTGPHYFIPIDKSLSASIRHTKIMQNLKINIKLNS